MSKLERELTASRPSWPGSVASLATSITCTGQSLQFHIKLWLYGCNRLCYRFVGTACFIAGNVTEGLGYKFGADYPTHLDVDAAANSSVIDDDEANYVEFHPVKIGVCLQGFAIVILMSHLLTYLCLVSEIVQHLKEWVFESQGGCLRPVTDLAET